MPPGYGVPAYGPRPGTDDTAMATLVHLLGLFSTFLGPLTIYLVKKDESPFVRRHAAEALNFQITMTIAYVISLILTFFIVGLFVMLAVGAFWLTFSILATFAANRGEDYRYPINIRMVS